MRRTPLGYVAALGALLSGGGLCLAASGLSWGEALEAGPAATSVSVTGGELLPALQAVGLLALAGIVAVHATKRWGRRAVAGVLALAGLATAVWAFRVALELPSRVLRQVTGASGTGEFSSASAQPFGTVPAIAGGLLIAAAGLALLIRGARWPAMGARYVRSASGRAGAGERSAWEALDRGEDPTL